jgi:hypothetical protein
MGQRRVRECEGRPEDEMTAAGQVLRPETAPGSDPGKTRTVQHKEDFMKKLGWVLLALLVVLPFAAVPASAQVSVGVGVGPALVAPGYYGPPDCEWGYYNYYPYACAPYGYYGPNWFLGGLFIGAGPWYHWGFYGHPGYYLRGGFGYRGGYGYGRGGYAFGARGGYAGHGYVGGAGRGYTGGGVAHSYSGGARGGFSGGGGGGFHGGGGGHGGGGHR